MPIGQLGQELSLHQVDLQKIFDQASNASLSTPSATREIRRKLLSELRTVPVIGFSWEINAAATKHPDPEMLKLLEKSPGTLGYLDSDAER
jgi:hypothetical protein